MSSTRLKVARDSGMGGRINTIMQVCFFALSGVLSREKAIEAIKYSIKKTYGKKGEEVVAMNLKAVDRPLANLHQVPVQRRRSPAACRHRSRPNAPRFVKEVPAASPPARRRSARQRLPCDGTFPTGTRAIRKAQSRAGNPCLGRKNLHPMFAKCAAICPHATIRAKSTNPRIWTARRRDSSAPTPVCPSSRA
jgi:pyruvate-ferredoxin/flavodoxin oxidoreductase